MNFSSKFEELENQLQKKEISPHSVSDTMHDLLNSKNKIWIPSVYYRLDDSDLNNIRNNTEGHIWLP